MLSKKFLGGQFQHAQLNQIAELAISESNLTTVQTFIKEILEPFEPTPAHLLIPKFRWSGIATTNYDRLIETAYERCSDALQIPKPFIENGDSVEERMKDPKGVMLLKLHGCITRLSNPICPLILTTDQYVSHRQGRSRIFEHLRDWACEFPIIFVGSSLQDPDIRAILQEMVALFENRPRFYIVTPEMNDIEARFWESKRISPIKATFDEFMQHIDRRIAAEWRKLAFMSQPSAHPIRERFAEHNAKLSSNCEQFLNSDVEYVKSINVTETVSPEDFYKGYSNEWSAIEQKLDVRRNVTDTILADRILEEEERKPKRPELIFIKAHAGAGKTTLLRRLAWDAAKDYDRLCLFLKQSGSINTAAIQEIIKVCKERVYLFIDDVADRVAELNNLIRNIDQFGKQLTIVAAERVNEWNVLGGIIAPNITSEYELKYLTNFEIDKLISLLATHKALGTLDGKSLEEQKKAFHEVAGRQLLVALHEATLGIPFEDIIENEYKGIIPAEAQKIYLTICVLNRFGVPVRAGIIARIHGIRFEEFKERLFKPLEHVVNTSYDNVVRDFMYSARHPFIAEIVFDRVLRNQEEKYDHYIRSLNALNADYDCDRRALRRMIRGRSLLDIFSNTELAKNVFEAAERLIRDDPYLTPYLLHQKGLYEMHRGNHDAAGKLFSKAEKLSPGNLSIKHSKSELLIKMAEQARTDLEKNKLLREATDIATFIKNSKPVDESFAFHTLVKIDLQRLSDLLAKAKDSDHVEIESIVKNVEKNLNEGLQQFPGDSYLLTAESNFASLLNDSERAVECLRKAFEANPRISFVAFRLARYYEDQNDIKEATSVLEKALSANRNDQSLHYHFAKHLMQHSKNKNDTIQYHLQRSFSPGDKNYDAQLLYGRQLYINGNSEDSRKIFNQLKEARIAPEFKAKLLYPLDDIFYGTVIRIEGNYLFINRDAINDRIYAHRNSIEDGVWNKLTIGARCSFKIAFNFHGASAAELKIISSR